MVIVQPLPVTPRLQHKGHFDRGAAAVEMALVLPVLLFLLMAMIDFGRAYSAQIQLSQAAREGVRLASLNLAGSAASSDPNFGDTAITTRLTSAAGGLPPFSASCSSVPTNAMSYACITYCPTTANQATVVVKSNFTWITGISGMSKFFGSGTFPTPTALQSTGVMRCAG